MLGRGWEPEMSLSVGVWEAGTAELPALKLRDRLDCL